jgi:putative membrane protein (TIGR04086 family)
MKFLQDSNKSVLRAHTKGTLYALVIMLSAVLILAFAVKFVGLSNGIIKPSTQAIKVVSIFFGVVVALKYIEKNAWLHGAVLGLVYTVLAFLVFSVIDTDFSITSGLFIDAGFASITGLISAMFLRFRKRSY